MTTHTHLPFQLPRTFLGLKNHTQEHVVILGAPTDSATTFRSGARMGPHAVRDASLMLCDGVHEIYPAVFDDWVADAGDLALPTSSTVAMLNIVQHAHQEFIKNEHHVITLGGDHSITLACLRSQAAHHGPMAVLHLDAHCDTWSDHFGETYGHGTWMYNAIQEGLVIPEKCMSVGVRSPADDVSRNFLKSHGGQTISARRATALTPLMLSDMIKQTMGDQTPVYLSLDVDCLDPAHAPGTGTPEIGGLTSMFVSTLLDELYDVNWQGMDLVEVAPAYDHSQITALAGATFVWQYLSMLIHKKMG